MIGISFTQSLGKGSQVGRVCLAGVVTKGEDMAHEMPNISVLSVLLGFPRRWEMDEMYR
jgi:hypothetical protein